jgi:cell division protein FtsB
VKLLCFVLASLLALIQYPLWLGHGSWLRVWELDRQLGLQQEVNAGKRMRNEGLEAEASDLRDGTLAIEERARYELGMVKRDEIFVQFNPASGPADAGAVPGAGAGPAARPPAPAGGGHATDSGGDNTPAAAPRRAWPGMVTVGR